MSAAALSTSYWQFVIAQALLIGMLGSSATFGPLVADVSHWFVRQRGIAVAIVASGNYVAGTIWPPLLQDLFDAVGWRHTYMIVGAICVVTMVPLSLLLRPTAGARGCGGSHAGADGVRPDAAFAGRSSGDTGDRGAGLLHRHVHAAGAYHRLLRRSRLWHWTRAPRCCR